MMMAIRLLLTRMTQMPLRGATGKNCSRVVTQRRICQKSLGKSPVTRNRRWALAYICIEVWPEKTGRK